MTTTETWPTATPEHHGDDRQDQQLAVLTETRDYTRRIHWWIRLFGVVWLTTMVLGVLIGGGLGILAARTADKFNDVGNSLDNSSSYSSRSACLSAPETTTAQCNAQFGTK
jgi:hypothetical protein